MWLSDLSPYASEEWARVIANGFADVHLTSAFARLQPQNTFLLYGDGWHQVVVANGTMISSPYQYGGPVGARDEAQISMVRDFGYVAEYCCLHPELPTPPNVIHLRSDQVVVMDLSNIMLARRVRRGCAAAQKAGARFSETSPANFARLYASAMERKNADEKWRLTEAQCDAYARADVGARFFWCGIYGDGERTLLTIGKGPWAYAHLLGSDGKRPNDGLDHMLYARAAEEMARAGFRYFHLGGGLTGSDGDPLLAFKAGFSPLRRTVLRYGKIFDQEAYDRLLAAKVVQELAEHGRESTAKWFPEYERPFK